MADEGRSVYWPIMVAAGIGALGTVAAAVLGRVDVGGLSASGGSGTTSLHRAAPAARQDTAALPADWIDARGRYYSVRATGGSVGVIAYDGGARALAHDRVRLTGDGTSAGGHVAWTWADAKGKLSEYCTGRATPSAITLHCAPDGGDGHDLRLVAR